MDKLRPWTKRVCPAFDLTDQVESKVGVEFYIKNAPEEDPLVYWNELLDVLIEEKFCTASKKKGILAYPQQIRSSDVKEEWPSSLLNMEAFLNGKKSSAFLLSVHHLKLTLSPTKQPIAKIYLAVKSIWIP